MSKCYLLLVLVLATACGRTDSAPIDADDHQTCLGYGFTLEQTDLSPARCACNDHAEEQLISHNGRAHPRAAAASARLLPHLAGRPARPAFESMRERADILVTEQPRNLGNRQAFVRQMALGEI